MNLTTITKKIILVTGATDGIGLEAAKALVEAGHHVLLHGRCESKLQAVVSSLMNNSSTTTSTARVETFRADFSRLAEVNAMANQILATHSKLDVLINNAGVLKPTTKEGTTTTTRTADQLDVRFAVNTIAPYLLTKRLLPILKRRIATTSTTTRNNSNATTTNTSLVINIASAVQKIVDAGALMGKKEAALADFDCYAQSKLATIMWNHALAAQYANIAFVALNPGSMLATNMVKEQGLLGGPMDEGNPISIGRDILVKAALTFGMEYSGKYFDNDRQTFGTAHHDASDPVKCQQVVDDIEMVLRDKGVCLDDDA